MRKYLFLLVIPILAFSFPFQGKRVAEDEKCMECHTGILQGKIAHIPVKQGCGSCHTSNGKQHPQADVKGFSLSKDMPELCYQCHSRLDTMSKVHGVVKNGKCMLCHTPHSSDNDNLLKESPSGKICLECHDDLGFDEFTAKHQPIEKGECMGCHDPHQSTDPKLLKITGQDLCYSCHTKEKAGLNLNSVHPPFQNKCTICHKAHGSSEEYMMTQKPLDLCFGCHDNLQEEVEKAAFPHKVVREGKNCMTCHSPHSSTNDSLLLSARMGDICQKCHDLGINEKKVKHGAVISGQCQACHEPHRSENKHLVKDLTNELCLKCHTKEKEQLSMSFVHGPFKNKCSICHTPHASDEPALLKNKTQEQCVGCHDDFEEPLQISKYIHQPMKDERSCINCHSPHASQNEKIILADQKTLCLNCHNKVIKSGERSLSNMKQFFQKNKFPHGAIEKNGCSGCHNPHYSDISNLLTGKFPDGFYISGDKDSLSLCFNCHDSKLLEEKTTTVTQFRHGDKNLHYIHVQGKKGRNCSVCHEIHAGVNKYLLKEKIPFGNWTMNMVFTGSENGGSCQSGCHEEKTYKR
ncbi:MAG: cytochrome c3 family protein [Bacteroidales bacterium]